MLIFSYFFLFIFTILVSITIFQVSIYTKKGQDIQNRKNLFDRYTTIKNILDESKEIAYNKVYRENLLAHNASSFRIDDSLIQECGKTYVKLVLECCGESILKDLVQLFGSIDSLCVFLLTGFVNKVIEFESQLLTKSVDEDSEPEDLQNFLLDSKT